MFVKITDILVVFAIVTANSVNCADVATSSNRDVKISYPDQFIPSGNKFFFVGGVGNENHAGAKIRCQEVGAELAFVDSAEEREALRSALYNNDNLWNMYWFNTKRGEEYCPYWRPINGWYYEKDCSMLIYWICETKEPLNVAHRVWTGAI